MMIGTDSHTVNAGGLGMIAIGVGGADACDVMAGLPWEMRFPRLIGIHLTGKLSGWASAKDVILKVAGILTVKGGTGCILEYFGEGANPFPVPGKERSATWALKLVQQLLFLPMTARWKTIFAGRTDDVADGANQMKEYLTADEDVYKNPSKYFDQLIEINLSELEPHINGPFTPDLATPVSQFASLVKEKGWPEKLEVGLIGSCTNSSYEDLTRAASVAQQAIDKKLKAQSSLR